MPCSSLFKTVVSRPVFMGLGYDIHSRAGRSTVLKFVSLHSNQTRLTKECLHSPFHQLTPTLSTAFTRLNECLHSALYHLTPTLTTAFTRFFATTMAAMNTMDTIAAMNTKDTSHDPYEEPEVVRELWRPKCIPIDGGPSKPSINIMDALLPSPSTRQTHTLV